MLGTSFDSTPESRILDCVKYKQYTLCVCTCAWAGKHVFPSFFRGAGHPLLSVHFLEHLIKRNSGKFPGMLAF